MTNNFVRQGNLSDDAIFDNVAKKIHFESVITGTGSPVTPPSLTAKRWLYVDRSLTPAILWLWDPSVATWVQVAEGAGTAHTHPATAVSTVPATTGLDPASTDVEKALTELAARPSGGSAPITKPKVPYGSYLNPLINFMWSTPGGAYVWWVPLSVECPQVFDAIGLVVQSAGAGVTADFALVGDVGGYPGTVLRSSTGVSLTTATDASKVGAFSAVSLPVGLVWMAVRIADPNNNCQVASAANTGQQPWGVPYAHFKDLPPYPAGGAHTSYGGAYRSASVLSSIPTTAPSGMTGLSRDSPLPGLRAAAW